MNRPKKREPRHRFPVEVEGVVLFATGHAKDSKPVDVDELRDRGRLRGKAASKPKPKDGWPILSRIIRVARRLKRMSKGGVKPMPRP